MSRRPFIALTPLRAILLCLALLSLNAHAWQHDFEDVSVNDAVCLACQAAQAQLPTAANAFVPDFSSFGEDYASAHPAPVHQEEHRLPPARAPPL